MPPPYVMLERIANRQVWHSQLASPSLWIHFLPKSQNPNYPSTQVGPDPFATMHHVRHHFQRVTCVNIWINAHTHTHTDMRKKIKTRHPDWKRHSLVTSVSYYYLYIIIQCECYTERKKKIYLFDSLHWVFVGMVSGVISAGPWCHTKCLPLLRRPTQTTNLLLTEWTHTEGLKASLLIHAIHLAWCETIN